MLAFLIRDLWKNGHVTSNLLSHVLDQQKLFHSDRVGKFKQLNNNAIFK